MSMERAKIICVGVGGCGCNIITELSRLKVEAKTIAVNTDFAVLRRTSADILVHIGAHRRIDATRGAGGMPTIGAEIMEEEVDRVIENIDEDADMVIGIAGMGGGTGTGGLPILFRHLKTERPDAIRLAIVTLPFKAEGPLRKRNAEYGLRQIMQVSDAYIVFSNELLRRKHRFIAIPEGFRMMNRIIADIINQIVRIDEPGLMNIDFSDVRGILREGGLAFAGVGRDRRSLRLCLDKVFDCDYAATDITNAHSAVLVCEGMATKLKEEDITYIQDIFSAKYKIANIFMALRTRPAPQAPWLQLFTLVVGVKSNYIQSFLRGVV